MSFSDKNFYLIQLNPVIYKTGFNFDSCPGTIVHVTASGKNFPTQRELENIFNIPLNGDSHAIRSAVLRFLDHGVTLCTCYVDGKLGIQKGHHLIVAPDPTTENYGTFLYGAEVSRQ